ncbi:MAG: hypothetical protein WHT09_10205 [Thermogutta sp.]
MDTRRIHAPLRNHPSGEGPTTIPRGSLRQEALLALACVVVGLIIGATAVLVYRNHLRSPRTNALPERFVYTLDNYVSVPEEKIVFEPAWQLEIPGKDLRRLAVLEATAWVAVDDQLLPVALSANGGRLEEKMAVSFSPQCLAVARHSGGQDGRTGKGSDSDLLFFVGSGSRVIVVSAAGDVQSEWSFFGSKAVITDIAVAGEEVFVADAGNRVVHRVDRHGEKIAEIGHRDVDRGILGFIIPSPYFDLAWGSDGLLRVVNPGVHRVEVYTREGDLEIFWGKAGLDEAGFCGCCNPAHIALFSDGRVVTAEKGIPRVKVYSAHGELLGWVASPEHFAPSRKWEETRDEDRLPVLDVEVFSPPETPDEQWVLILDPGRSVLEAFRPKKTGQPPTSDSAEGSATQMKKNVNMETTARKELEPVS